MINKLIKEMEIEEMETAPTLYELIMDQNKFRHYVDSGDDR